MSTCAIPCPFNGVSQYCARSVFARLAECILGADLDMRLFRILPETTVLCVVAVLVPAVSFA
jgi:hypothetical protein